MNKTYLKYENALFRVSPDGLHVEIEHGGQWGSYDEDDWFDVTMRGMPVDEDYVKRWIAEDQKQPTA